MAEAAPEMTVTEWMEKAVQPLLTGGRGDRAMPRLAKAMMAFHRSPATIDKDQILAAIFMMMGIKEGEESRDSSPSQAPPRNGHEDTNARAIAAMEKDAGVV